jgi:magnesium-transporting ATPase (P-type)
MADSNDNETTSRNPFSRRTSLSNQSILLYKITTTLTYLLFLITTIYYTIHAPHDGDTKHHHNASNARFWAHNYSTPFAQSAIITSIYWATIFVLQLGYLAAFYSANEEYLLSAANLAAHFISSNLLLFGFVHLWVRSHFILSLLLLLVNFANLSTAYFRHSTTPRFIHIGVLVGPLAWNFVGLYWAGSVAVWQSHANSAIARIVANVFIWGWVGYAGIFLVGFKDYSMGYALSILAFCTYSHSPLFPRFALVSGKKC